MAIWSRFFGSAGSQAVGIALGTAAVPSLLPAAQYLVNDAWHDHPNVPLLAAQLAEGVASGELAYEWARDQAQYTGINKTRFDALVQVADAGPGVSEAFRLWRRGEISEQGFRRALKRASLEDEWIDHLANTKGEHLSPAQVALAIVRSLVDSEGMLVGENPTSGGKIASTPVSPIDPTDEAAAAGIDKERLRVMINSIGLPMAPGAAAESVFRNIIEKPDFYLAVAQGDVRPAWADAMFEHAKQIPSVADYVNAHIRGWITEAEMHAGAARHGMSQADVDLLYLRTGRPAAPGQMATAAARGIDGPDGRPMDKAQFLKGIKQSDIRPEWGEMLWDARFLYPPLFQITRLVQAGAITVDVAVDWATKDRYPPDVIGPLRKYWETLEKPPADELKTPFADKAQTQLWNTLHRSYVQDETSYDQAQPLLDALGVPANEQLDVLRYWDAEKALTRSPLSKAQIKKAWVKVVRNPATGQPWTRDEAIEELVDRGMSVADANTYLDTPPTLEPPTSPTPPPATP